MNNCESINEVLDKILYIYIQQSTQGETRKIGGKKLPDNIFVQLQ